MNFRLDLHPTEANSKDVGFGAINYFVAKDFDKAIEDLQAKGVKVGASLLLGLGSGGTIPIFPNAQKVLLARMRFWHLPTTKPPSKNKTHIR